MAKSRTPEIEERLAHRRRRVLLTVTGIVSIFSLDDVLTGGAETTLLMFIRGCWVFFFLAIALSLVRASPKSRRSLLRLLAVVSATCLSLLAMVRGDQHTAYFAFQLAVPLCIVVLLQDEVGAVVLGAVTTLLGAGLILFVHDANLQNLPQWLTGFAASSVIAIYASIHQRSQLNEESEQQLRLADSERGRAQAERLALVGQLAAGVAHEVNNPLAFISSNLTFIGEELPAGHPELRAVLEETRSGLKRIGAIVGDLTAFSRGGAELTSTIDLRAIVSEAQRMASMRTKGRVEVLNQLAVNVPQVIGNERHLCQVFLNLILNAADELTTAGTPNGKIWVHASSDAGNQLRVDVDDNGPGIPSAVLPSLFTPFFTTKPVGKGTGLGLATSREYLRRAGGDLLASARPGGGARFTLTLQLAA